MLDNTTEEIISNESWTCYQGMVIKSDIYDDEVCNASSSPTARILTWKSFIQGGLTALLPSNQRTGFCQRLSLTVPPYPMTRQQGGRMQQLLSRGRFFLVYGDVNLLKRQFDSMRRWVDIVTNDSNK